MRGSSPAGKDNLMRNRFEMQLEEDSEMSVLDARVLQRRLCEAILRTKDKPKN